MSNFSGGTVVTRVKHPRQHGRLGTVADCSARHSFGVKAEHNQEWEAKMASVDTDWDGIVIVIDASTSSHFVGLVNSALAKIASKPVGKALLDGIEAKSAISYTSAGVKFSVKILPQKSEKKSFLFKSWRVYQKGSVTFAMSDTKACDSTGVASAVKWDPQNKNAPDGARPPFIGLAHELIHCYYNLHGGSLHNKTGKDQDEAQVVGLSGYEQNPISENRIRAEHNVPYRKQYNGQCEGAIWIPDENLLA